MKRAGGAFAGISFLWGLAEAIFFFIVPDVWLSRLAISDMRKAWIGIFLALFGALVGGAVMYYVGAFHYTAGVSFLDSIPGISNGMISSSRHAVEDRGMTIAFLGGALNGIPIKIFSLHSGTLGEPVVLFTLAMFFSRLLRFCAVTLLTRFIAVHVRRYCSLRIIYITHAVCWLIFYAIYFSKAGI